MQSKCRNAEEPQFCFEPRSLDRVSWAQRDEMLYGLLTTTAGACGGRRKLEAMEVGVEWDMPGEKLRDDRCLCPGNGRQGGKQSSGAGPRSFNDISEGRAPASKGDGGHASANKKGQS